MTDIRLVQPRTSRIWGIAGLLAVLGLLLWASVYVVGDATVQTEGRGVGATAGFGEGRAPVLPAKAAAFSSLTPPSTRDLGRLVNIVGVAESGVAASSIWVRTPDNFRVLVRFEPVPPAGALAGIGAGSSVSFIGYVSAISIAEFHQIVDSLGVRVPRPPPARKFGDLPDPGFARVDSLFIKDYYVSVRPEGIHPDLTPDLPQQPST